MSIDKHDLPDWPAPIELPEPGATDTGPVADAIVAEWNRIDAALHPIVGRRGVAALYQRSLKLTLPAHPWLAECLAGHTGLMADIDTGILHRLLMQQSAAHAAEAGNALFQEFRNLLASLIGSSLTHRLLRGIWGPPPAGTPSQDPSK
jgi:hypothetical protein